MLRVYYSVRVCTHVLRCYAAVRRYFPSTVVVFQTRARPSSVARFVSHDAIIVMIFQRTDTLSCAYSEHYGCIDIVYWRRVVHRRHYARAATKPSVTTTNTFTRCSIVIASGRKSRRSSRSRIDFYEQSGVLWASIRFDFNRVCFSESKSSRAGTTLAVRRICKDDRLQLVIFFDFTARTRRFIFVLF